MTVTGYKEEKVTSGSFSDPERQVVCDRNFKAVTARRGYVATPIGCHAPRLTAGGVDAAR